MTKHTGGAEKKGTFLSALSATTSKTEGASLGPLRIYSFPVRHVLV